MMRKTFWSVLVLMLFLSPPAMTNDSANNDKRSWWPQSFRDWWQTPEQQALSAWENGDNETLKEVAPTQQWQGAANYRSGEFDAAREAYSTNATSTNDISQSFNLATTNIQLGQYAQAIEQLDAVLEVEPAHEDASVNREIAQRLLDLEQQEQQQQGEGGESGENSESSDGDDSDSSSNDQQDQSESSSESDDGSESSEGQNSESQSEQNQQQNGDSESGDSEDSSDNNTQSEEEREAEIEAAREALQAAGDENENSAKPQTSELGFVGEGDEPMSEAEQATEQWLRQIPDDPDDLLRRKLLQNHRSEYPDVQRNGRGY